MPHNGTDHSALITFNNSIVMWSFSGKSTGAQGRNSGALVEESKQFAWFRARYMAPGSEHDYYGLLEVSKNASQSEIRRAYYVKARDLHPDKNPGDEGAKAKFQAISNAYSVLSNEELRAKYDAHGVDGLDVDFVDGAELFAALFGSDSFLHLIGELKLATIVRVNADMELLQEAQRKRVEDLTLNLKIIIMRYTCGDEEGFTMSMTEEAAALSRAPHGPNLLNAIGKAYQSQAQIELGNFFSSGIASMKRQGRVIKGHFRAINYALKALHTQQELVQLENKSGAIQSDQKEMTEQEIASARADIEEKALPIMLDTMWAVNAVDIDGTLTKVCRNVLREKSISDQERKSRAEALYELGRIFRSFKYADEQVEKKTAKERMEQAVWTMMEKKMDDR